LSAARLFYLVEEGYWPKRPFLFLLLFHVICSSFAVFECGKSGKWTVSKKKVSPFYIFFFCCRQAILLCIGVLAEEAIPLFFSM